MHYGIYLISVLFLAACGGAGGQVDGIYSNPSLEPTPSEPVDNADLNPFAPQSSDQPNTAPEPVVPVMTMLIFSIRPRKVMHFRQKLL
jgi:hypothetical protein